MNNKNTWGCPHHLSWDETNPAAKKVYQEINAASIDDLRTRYWDAIEKIWEEETFGLAGHVINSLWKNFKKSKYYDSDIIENSNLNGHTWRNFSLSCIKKLDEWREQVIRNAYDNIVSGSNDKEDWVNSSYAVYRSIQKEEAGISIPSFTDYPIFFTAIAEVVEKLGWNPEEIMGHPRTKKIFTDLMQNSRELSMAFLWKLEWWDKNPFTNINNEYRIFQKEYFEIVIDQKSKPYIQIKQNVVKEYREWMKQVLNDINPDVAKELRNNVHTCPLLYTWLAIEIYNWLYEEMLKIN